MPRMKNETSALVADLKSRIERIVETARQEGRTRALSELSALVAGGLPVKRGPGRPPKSSYAAAAPAKPKKRRKNPWASMSAEQKADRVRKMLAGRGLKPKSDR